MNDVSLEQFTQYMLECTATFKENMRGLYGDTPQDREKFMEMFLRWVEWKTMHIGSDKK